MLTKDELKDTLKENVLQIVFKKVDGSEREMTCTLRPDLMGKYEPKDPTRKKAEKEDVLPVWDLHENAFRSFRIESLIKYRTLQELTT